LYITIQDTLKELTEDETLNTKSSICEAIIKSTLFRQRHHCNESLDLGNDVTYDEVLRDYANQVEVVNRTQFTNAYVSRTVDTSQSEEVFLCFARKSGSKNLAQYFISREYVTKGPVHFGNSCVPTGRFVFERRDGDEGDLTAIAFAENEEYHDISVYLPQNDNWQNTLYEDFWKLNKLCCKYD